MDKSIKYDSIIDFGNESIDVTRQCCEYLKKKKFYANSLEDNISILEKSLINYSIIKLISWNVNLCKPMQLDSLESICKLLNSNIPSSQQQISFFAQYIHCIIYIIGAINKQKNEIKWLVMEDTDDEIEIEYFDQTIVSIITDNKIPLYQLPYKLLEKLKSYYRLNEKNPILKK